MQYLALLLCVQRRGPYRSCVAQEGVLRLGGTQRSTGPFPLLLRSLLFLLWPVGFLHLELTSVFQGPLVISKGPKSCILEGGISRAPETLAHASHLATSITLPCVSDSLSSPHPGHRVG